MASLCTPPVIPIVTPAIPIPIPVAVAAAVALAMKAINDARAALAFPFFCPLD